jgi:hypothetical protein
MKPPAIALKLAAHGLPTFPCATSKKPTTKRGYLDATADLPALHELWRRHPGPLVGIPTGPMTGFDVLDIDPKHGGDQWLAEHQHALPMTRVHRTRSGGEHWLFVHTPGIRNSQAKLAPGVDTRGEGGYIIWWPGFGGRIVCDAKAAPWPAWLLERLLPKPHDEAASAIWRERMAGDDTAARRLIQRQLERLASAPPGERHFRLRAAARTIGGLLDLDGATTRSDAARRLLAAVQDAGGDDVNTKNAAATIAWALEKGAAKPLRMGGQNG